MKKVLSGKNFFFLSVTENQQLISCQKFCVKLKFSCKLEKRCFGRTCKSPMINIGHKKFKMPHVILKMAHTICYLCLYFIIKSRAIAAGYACSHF
jgi:hypothetical protein